jgi:hypothetical protein
MFGPDLAERGTHPGLEQAADATFAVLTAALERGQSAGEVRPGSFMEQAVAAWSLVHGLTLLLIDRRLAYIGVSSPEAERQARLACEALIDGLGHPGPAPSALARRSDTTSPG